MPRIVNRSPTVFAVGEKVNTPEKVFAAVGYEYQGPYIEDEGYRLMEIKVLPSEASKFSAVTVPVKGAVTALTTDQIRLLHKGPKGLVDEVRWFEGFTKV